MLRSMILQVKLCNPIVSRPDVVLSHQCMHACIANGLSEKSPGGDLIPQHTVLQAAVQEHIGGQAEP